MSRTAEQLLERIEHEVADLGLSDDELVPGIIGHLTDHLAEVSTLGPDSADLSPEAAGAAVIEVLRAALAQAAPVAEPAAGSVRRHVDELTARELLGVVLRRAARRREPRA